jgi:hypothetical protein
MSIHSHPVKAKDRGIASGLAGATFGAIFASLFWAWMTPDNPMRAEYGSPVYYGGLECYRTIEPLEQHSPIMVD